MSRTCFGDLKGATSCWGYKLKLVRGQQESKDVLLKNVRLFSLKELRKATNSYSTYLGMGGFSSIYKGTLENGSVVAIKVLSHGKEGSNQKKDLEFISFINMMSIIRHRNVVQIIGCCFEGDRRIVVYEFVGDYSLDKLLFTGDLKAKQSQLSWPTRASICIGIARGLEYLHEGVSPRVVHRDIKTANIVLDNNFNPKIVGLEIARVFDDGASRCSSPVAGTFGYLDPEYLTRGEFTEKTDVYSFGILLLEVISGRKVYEFLKGGNGVTLVNWVWELREVDRVLEIVDPTLSDFPEDEVKRFIEVALACVQYSSNLRPSMSEALLMLLGPYDFSKKVLRNPELSLSPSYHYEVDRPSHDEKIGKAEVIVASSDAISPIHYREAGGKFGRAPRQSTPERRRKATRDFEIEIESDLDTHSSASELMELSQVLETELYQSIEGNISAAASVSGPSGENVVKSELFNPSTEVDISSSPCTDIRVHEGAVEAGKQTQMSHNVEGEIQMSEPSLSEFLFGQTAVKTGVLPSSSAEFDSFVQNEVVDRKSFQAETIIIDEVALPQVDMKRPIQCTLEIILEALKGAHHRRICLYGRGGSGKTTVLNNLFHDSAPKDLFDYVLFVTVPRFAYQKYVRDEIVQQLSLNVQTDSCSEDEICTLIHQALVGKKLLVLLDDVREPINFHEIGLHPEDNYWVVLATRSLDVCHAFADREIEMEVLSDEEAWALFFYRVGDVIRFPEIKPYALAISKECYGSPLIISAIASALKTETSVEEWKLALRNLQFGGTANANERYSFKRHIKYCYDRLKAQDLKTCFLYATLFQQDREIEASMLVDCFVSEGFVGGTTVAAYNRGHDILELLLNASLLEANDNGLVVKMHNVVRDSALEILLSDIEGYQVLVGLLESGIHENQFFQERSWSTKLFDDTDKFNIELPSICKFLTRAGAHLKDSPSMEEWEQATMIFLMDNELSRLPSKPSCSNLMALLLQRNCSLRVIPASFFDSMSALKILNLSKTRIKSLPDSFSRLRSLQILLLRDCERLLLLPPSIGLLKNLEVLDLQGTEVTHLPDSFGGLANLKQLRVSFYGSLNQSEYYKLPSKLVSDGIFSSLKLRELGMLVYPGDQRWPLNASGITKEISSLKLSLLFFHFPNLEDLENFMRASQSWKDRELMTFKFIVGDDFKRIVSLVSNDAELLYEESQRCLRFVNGKDISFAVVEVLTRATSFYLDHHLNILYLSQFGIGCFNGLKICILRDCPELIAILDRQEQGRELFPVLEYLSINYLWNLKGILGCNVRMGSFVRLRCLSVYACPKLSYVLTYSMLGILTNLEELVIEDCVSLKYVVIEDEDAEEIMYGDSTSEVMDKRKPEPFIAREFCVLRSLKVLKLHYLPEMCDIWRARWPRLEYISFYNCPKLRNLHMEGINDVNIKKIAADKAWWDSLEWDDSALSRRLHKHVTQIHIDDL